MEKIGTDGIILFVATKILFEIIDKIRSILSSMSADDELKS